MVQLTLIFGTMVNYLCHRFQTIFFLERNSFRVMELSVLSAWSTMDPWFIIKLSYYA